MRRLILGFIVLTGLTGALVPPALAQTPPPTAAPPAVATADDYVRTYFLTHVEAQEMQQVLAQLFQGSRGPRPSITITRTNNALTIRGTEATLRTAEEIIKQLDVPSGAQGQSTIAPQSTPPALTHSQTLQAAPPAQVPTAPQQSRLPGLPTLPSTTNIQLELTITDTISGTPTTKTVSMVILTGSSGMIRTAGATNDHFLNVDAVATAYQSGLIGVRLSFEFTPPPSTSAEGRANVRAPRLNESLTVVVLDGKPLVVSQSADAASDRTVTASITARVLKF